MPGATSGSASDLALVRATLSRRGDAVDTFLDRMRCVPRMISAHNRKLGRPLSSETLDDVIQESLVAVWRKLERFDGRSALETWVYPFCYFEFMRRLRMERGLPRLLDAPLEGSPHEPATQASVELFELEPLLAELEALEPDQAVVVRLKHFEDQTFEEIAVRLAISPNTAKTRYYRGLEKLRTRLGPSLAVPDEERVPGKLEGKAS